MSLTIISISQNHYMRGGSDRMFFETNKLLQMQGHRLIPFTAADYRNKPTEWEKYFPIASDFERHAPIDLLRYIYSRHAARALRKLINDHKLDIAHLHIYYGKLTGSILAPLRKAGIPIVQTLHEYKLICPVYTLVSNDKICEACHGRHFWRAIPRKCNRCSFARTLLSVTESYVSRFVGSLRSVDHFIAISNFVRDKMIAHGVSPRQITTIHNFIDSSRIKSSHQIGGYFLYFGRLERVKGIFTLIEAAAPMKKIPLLIIGDGNARNEIVEIIERRKLKHIKLLSFKKGKELSKIIRDSLCTILPAEWYEPFGLSIIESFAHARPVIASRIGGIPEIVADGQDGFLVEVGKIEDLREKMLWMAAHPREAMEMGMAGRKKVEKEFCPETHYEKLMQLYKKVM